MAHDRYELGRREFTEASILALLSGVAITISGCGSGGYGSPASPSPSSQPPTTTAAGDVVGSISANHGHRAVVTRVQITAGVGVSLDIRGSADHTHTVELSADEIGRIGAGQRVSTQSSSEAAHSHTVTFN